MFQDTVISLQALARYAAATKWSTTDLKIEVKDYKHNRSIKTFKVTSEDTNREFLVPLVSIIILFLFRIKKYIFQ